MAIRRPLKLDGSNNLIEMSDTDIANLKIEMIRQYGLNPSSLLSVGTGNLGIISDTRLQAGAYSTATATYPTEATTAEPSTVTVNYDKMLTATEATTTPDVGNRVNPIYFDGSNGIKAMSAADMRDTFALDAIDTLTSGSTTDQQAGTYHITTSATPPAGSSLVSGTPVFVDSKADTSLYTAAGIPETLDQPLTNLSYYLHIIDAAARGTVPIPLYINGLDHLQQYTAAELGTALADSIRDTAKNTVGSKITYSHSTGNNRGSGMVDTKLNGVGNYTTYLAGTNDYRAQEFPDGTAVTISTNYLKIGQS